MLAQVTEVYSVDDIINHRRQKVYKYFGFAKSVLILEVENTTKESQLECNKARTLNKKQSTTMEWTELKEQHI